MVSAVCLKENPVPDRHSAGLRNLRDFFQNHSGNRPARIPESAGHVFPTKSYSSLPQRYTEQTKLVVKISFSYRRAAFRRMNPTVLAVLYSTAAAYWNLQD